MRGLTRPGPAASPAEVHRALVTARGQLDRLEAIVIEVSAYRAGVRIRARELEQVASDAYDRRLRGIAQQGVRRDYEGAQERYAEARLDSLGVQQEARTAQRVTDIVASCEETVKALYRGLRDVREELLASLRYLAFENTLDR